MSEKYFLGCMTQQGFSTEFGKLMAEGGRFTYILKGGAGTGKSSLMKRIASEFEKSEHVVRFFCSSDPCSLDAVMLEDSDVLIVDGTSPHVFDPVYPAVSQKIIDLGQFWDAQKLTECKDNIITVTDKNKSLLARAKRFSAALSNVCSDSFNCARGCIDEEKLETFLARFYKKILPRKGNGTGKREMRQLSALTEYGCMTWTETTDQYIEKYLLRDEDFACAHLVCEMTAAEAVRRGFDVILCPCHGLNNTAYEHLLIPELGLALISSTPLNKLAYDSSTKINLSRFYDKTAVSRYRSRLKMNRLTIVSIADEVYGTIKAAKAVHDEIEKYYIEAMDFEKVSQLTEKLIAEIREK
jgi:hypothetical protein